MRSATRAASKRPSNTFRPKMVTAVHCETPSGTLNPVAAIGSLVKAHDVPLFYVDAVSSAGGAPLDVDDWRIDLCLVGTQKCLSALPDLGIVAVSERAWQAVAEVGYQGYDALAPWRTALADRWLPYTPSWQAMAALNVGLRPHSARTDCRRPSAATRTWRAAAENGR